MIKILNENFSKQVRKEVRKRTCFSRDVYVYYTIDNENKKGDLTIKFYNSIDVTTEISTPIELSWKLVSNGIHDGKSIKRIVFKIAPIDMVLDIITKDHILEAWRNAYGWDMQIIEKGIQKDTLYHISHIHFYDAKRSKSTTIKEVCFDKVEMIYTE